MWARPIEATCKGATTVDLLWLSPEAAMLCVQVGTMAIFADHLTVFADFRLPTNTMVISRWPQPSKIDWSQVDEAAWHASFQAKPDLHVHAGSSEDFLRDWAAHWEAQLHGHVQDQPDGALPARCQGRAKRSTPMSSPLTPPVAKPSRHGEVRLKNNQVSMAVHKWFRQLRRLQSYKHAALAEKNTLDAEVYRLQLWHSIKRATGFRSTFAQWWLQRRHKSPAAPVVLPLAPPDGHLARIIFEDFKINFERFELWHLRQKGKLIQAKYDDSCHALFRELRDPGRGQLDFLWDTITYSVLAFCHTTNQIHLDRPVEASSNGHWAFQNCALSITHVDGDVLTVATLPATLEVGDELQHMRFFTSLAEIHNAMTQLWRPRWQKTSTIGNSDWQRIVGFIQAFMPRCQFPLPSLTVQTWKHTLERFPRHAARGVDGIDIVDLRHLPDQATQQLLDFLGQINGTSCRWPAQLLFGKVLSLAKQDHSHLPGHFRPVVILSCIYRAWSRLQAGPLLRSLAERVPTAAQGFLPGRECAQVWMQLQGYIELCLQHHLDFCGFSADLEKCFNNIDRDVLFALATHIGFPPSLLISWRTFLDSFQRAFEVRTSLSPALTSTQGLPEGCSLSVVGMVLVDWAYHVYMRILTPSVHLFSYVDNLTTAGTQALAVVSAFFSTKSFFELWGHGSCQKLCMGPYGSQSGYIKPFRIGNEAGCHGTWWELLFWFSQTQSTAQRESLLFGAQMGSPETKQGATFPEDPSASSIFLGGCLPWGGYLSSS